ncbi:MAG: hypothetical protein IJO46_10270, partial [Thermoguttaceae bacterium]|nr:hypothetical protein [Thermoguttaceae bacterium]
MSKLSRRSCLFASLRRGAALSLLCAALGGSVGCAGGSNPFCCNSNEKSQIDQNLERAQSLDENEQSPTAPEENDEENNDGKEESGGQPLHAGILQTDGSGDATQLAVAPATLQTFAEEPQEPRVADSTSADAQETPAPTADSTDLLQAPVLPSTVQTPQTAQSNSSAVVPENADAPNAASEAPQTNETPENVDGATSALSESSAQTSEPNAEKEET